jgi:hypothetical protein
MSGAWRMIVETGQTAGSLDRVDFVQDMGKGRARCFLTSILIA